MKTFYPYNPASAQVIELEEHTIINGKIRLNSIPKENSLEVRGFVEAKTAINLQPNQFFCAYRADTAYREADCLVYFYAGRSGQKVYCSYIAIGTVVTADDMNEINSSLVAAQKFSSEQTLTNVDLGNRINNARLDAQTALNNHEKDPNAHPQITTELRNAVSTAGSIHADLYGRIKSNKDDLEAYNISYNAELKLKVDKVNGKQLSTNDFTNAYKSQLDSLDTTLSSKVDTVQGKQLSTNDFTDDYKVQLDGLSSSLISLYGGLSDLDEKLDLKVDKVSGKQLSTNDFTASYKSQLDSLDSALSGKVDKVNGKQLSTNDFTASYKSQLDSLNSALNGKVDKVNGKQLSTNDFTASYKSQLDSLNTALSGKVDKVNGKQLSTNDFTDALKTQLEGLVETGGEANIINTVKVNGNALPVTDKAVNIDISGKVDKVSGKQLSTNDFTAGYKSQLDSLNTALNGKVDKVNGKQLSTNDFTNAYKSQLDGLTVATSSKDGLMSAQDKASLDSLFQYSSDLVDTVLAGVGSKFVPAASNVQAFLSNDNQIQFFDNRLNKICAGKDFSFDLNSGEVSFQNGEYTVRTEYGEDNNKNWLESSSGATISLVSDNATLTSYYYLDKLSETAGVMLRDQSKYKSASDEDGMPGKLDLYPFQVNSAGTVSLGSAVSLMGAATIKGDWYEYYFTKSIFDPNHIMIWTARAGDDAPRYCQTVAFNGTTNGAPSRPKERETLGTHYTTTLKSKTDTEATSGFDKPKITVENGKVKVSNFSWHGMPFMLVKQDVYNASSVLTSTTRYVLVHHGLGKQAPKKITLDDGGWLEDDNNLIAGVWRTRDGTNCYAITFKKGTYDYTPTWFDSAITVWTFDFLTPRIIKTNKKLSDVIDQLEL